MVRRYSPHSEWQPVTKHKSKRARLYEQLSYARCAVTLMGSHDPAVEYGIQGLETNSEWRTL